jgi:hypothetical protein
MARERIRRRDKNPLRAPDWRWVLAKNAANGYVNSRGLDRSTGMAFKFIRFLKEYKAKVEQGNYKHMDSSFIFTKYPSMHQAYTLFTADNYMKWAVEAYIIAGAPKKTIAEKTGCDVAGVSLYEDVFYDIRDRLKHPLYVIQEVLMPVAGDDTSRGDYNFLWKTVAYYCDTAVLEEFISNAPLSTKVKETIYELFEGQITRQALLSAFTRLPSKYTHHDIVEEYAVFTDKMRNKEGAASGSVDEQVKSLVDGISLGLAQLDKTGKLGKVEKQVSL